MVSESPRQRANTDLWVCNWYCDGKFARKMYRVFLLWQHILMPLHSIQNCKKNIGRLLGKSEKTPGGTDWKYAVGWGRFSFCQSKMES